MLIFVTRDLVEIDFMLVEVDIVTIAFLSEYGIDAYDFVDVFFL